MDLTLKRMGQFFQEKGEMNGQSCWLRFSKFAPRWRRRQTCSF